MPCLVGGGAIPVRGDGHRVPGRGGATGGGRIGVRLPVQDAQV